MRELTDKEKLDNMREKNAFKRGVVIGLVAANLIALTIKLLTK